jgi:hypothetical protein
MTRSRDATLHACLLVPVQHRRDATVVATGDRLFLVTGCGACIRAGSGLLLVAMGLQFSAVGLGVWRPPSGGTGRSGHESRMQFLGLRIRDLRLAGRQHQAMAARVSEAVRMGFQSERSSYDRDAPSHLKECPSSRRSIVRCRDLRGTCSTRTRPRLDPKSRDLCRLPFTPTTTGLDAMGS